MTTKGNTTFGAAENVEAALCYIPVMGWLIAVLFLVMEKSPVVRWNAMQSLLLSGFVFLLDASLVTSGVFAGLVRVVTTATLIINLILAVRAYSGRVWKLPLLGVLADKLINKV
jgi:uncharacterized membrane protein